VSCAVAVRARLLPTATSAGFADRPSTTGQTLNPPVIFTLPALVGSRHSRWRVTGVVMPAVMLKVAVPPHEVWPSLAVPVTVMP
jgi:hypothetical protein